MKTPTKPGFYWVKRTHGHDEWLPACVSNLGGVQVFGDVGFGDGSEVTEWGPMVGVPESLEIEDDTTVQIAEWMAPQMHQGGNVGRRFSESILRKKWKRR